MTLTGPQIVGGLKSLVENLVTCPIEVDVEEIEQHEPAGDGLLHGCVIDSGRFEKTLDGGPTNEWEGERTCVVEYQVLGANDAARKAKRDLFLPALVATLNAIDGDPTLGLDPQVFAEISGGQVNDIYLDDVGAMSVASISVTVLYVAPSAAG